MSWNIHILLYVKNYHSSFWNIRNRILNSKKKIRNKFCRFQVYRRIQLFPECHISMRVRMREKFFHNIPFIFDGTQSHSPVFVNLCQQAIYRFRTVEYFNGKSIQMNTVQGIIPFIQTHTQGVTHTNTRMYQVKGRLCRILRINSPLSVRLCLSP